jgi:hypothetical protein
MVLIPGQVMNAHFPNHIILDLYSGQATWQAFRRKEKE